MKRYLLKRLVFVLPTVFFISVLTFFLSSWVPGDPVEMLLNKQGRKLNAETYKIQYAEISKRLGLNLPKFYFNLSSPYWPGIQDSLTVSQLEFVEAINYEYKNQRAGLTILKILQKASKADSTFNMADWIESYQGNLVSLITYKRKIHSNKSIIAELEQTIEHLEKSKSNSWFNFPKFYWNGTQNQFHRWIAGVLNFDFGNSYHYGRKVTEIIRPALGNTLLLCILSLTFSYPFAILLGIYLAVNRNKKRVALIQTLLFGLYSIPVFWLATLLIFFLAGGDYFNIFPAFGLGDLPPEAPFLDRFIEKCYHLILPLFCYSYAGLALIANQMKTGIEQNLGFDYVRTAFAKGLNFNSVIFKHVFKNSIIPVLSLFAASLPYLLSSSVVIEVIFSINGIGKLAFDSLINRDYPIIFGIVFITSLITLLGNILADGLLFFVDPRISFQATDKT